MALEKLDSTIMGSVLQAYYTLGVVVEISALRQSRNGKAYAFMKITDLAKYDMVRVKRMLDQRFKDDEVLRKQLEKNYTSNGYKSLRVMVFGDAATACVS